MLERLEESETGVFDTHPATKDRIASAEAEQCDAPSHPITQGDGPAAPLVEATVAVPGTASAGRGGEA